MLASELGSDTTSQQTKAFEARELEQTRTDIGQFQLFHFGRLQGRTHDQCSRVIATLLGSIFYDLPVLLRSASTPSQISHYLVSYVDIKSLAVDTEVHIFLRTR